MSKSFHVINMAVVVSVWVVGGTVEVESLDRKSPRPAPGMADGATSRKA